MTATELKKLHLSNRINKLMTNELVNIRLINKAKRQLNKLNNT